MKFKIKKVCSDRYKWYLLPGLLTSVIFNNTPHKGYKKQIMIKINWLLILIIKFDTNNCPMTPY